MRMKNHKILTAASVGCCVFFISLLAYGISREEQAQIKTYGRSTLEGLSGVCVKVRLSYREDLDENLIKEQALQKIAEMQLRKAGVMVLDSVQDANAGILLITITVDSLENSPYYLVGTSVGFHQLVTLTRDSEILTFAATWPLMPSPRTYAYHHQTCKIKIPEIVSAHIQRFSADYLAANQ